MAQVLVPIRMDEDLQKQMEQICSELGMDIETAFNMFARKMCREQRIPFDVSIDPFYSEANMRHLSRGAAAMNAGIGVEHDVEDIDL